MRDDDDDDGGRRGLARALALSVAHFPFGECGADARAVGAAGVPVLALWGEADGVVPHEASF